MVEGRRLLFVNDSAGDRTKVPECLDDFERFDIAAAKDVLAPLLAEDRSDSPALVAVWGGDGSIRSVAALLVGTTAVLLACPGGTHNHFCRTIGLADVSDVESALESGAMRRIDVGTAGDEVFLNNLSIGWYTDLVARRERFERHVPRRVAKILSLPVQLFRTPRLRLVVDGRPERVWVFWAGNGEYSMSPGNLSARETMEGGVLDIRILRAGIRWPKLRVVLAIMNRDAESSSYVSRDVTSSATTLRSGKATIHAAIDGELVRLPDPVTIAVERRSLQVLLPPAALSIEAKPAVAQTDGPHEPAAYTAGGS